VARFQVVDYPGALAAAEQATALEPSQSPSWHYQGLALERMGRTETAHSRFSKAAKLDPENFPLHPGWDGVAWDKLLNEALDLLPQPLQGFYDGVTIRFSDYPAIEDLLESYPPLSPFTDALYRGQPPEDGDPWVVRPDYVALFHGNLSRPVLGEEDLIKRIADALRHEAMHWLGISQDINT
jgi:predicted Zn-dependent protease with MMP-like domain